jgi:hypothetical protein
MSHLMPAEMTGLTGVMAAPGTGTVWLTTFHAPVPHRPPAQLEEDVRPVHDRTGRLLDWVFQLGALRDEAIAVRHAAVQKWRSTWADERAIGDAATVVQFVDWAQRQIDAIALSRLCQTVGHFEPEELPKVHWEVARATQLCRASNQNGLGLMSDGKRLARGFVTGPSPLTLLSGYGTCLEVVGEQLVLTVDKFTATQLVDAGHPGAREFAVTSWRHTPRGVTAMTNHGPIELGHSHPSEFLHALAPGAAIVEVQPVPLSRMFAYLMVSVADIASLADHARQPLLVYRNPSGNDLARF